MSAPAIPLALPRNGFLAVSALMIAVTDVLALTSLPGDRTPVPAIVGVILFTAVGLLVATDRRPALDPRRTVVAAATPAALVLIVSWTAEGDYSLWHFSGGVFVLLALGLRGRLAAAWVGMTAMTAATVAWSLATGVLGDALGNLVRQVAVLVIGTVFAVAITRTQARLAAVTRDSEARAAEIAATEAAETERVRRLGWAHDLARELLVAIAERPRLDADTRRAAALTEAELRDGLRARNLAREPVTAAARGARRRGVEVVLLDDRGAELPDDRSEALLQRIAGELDAVEAGRIVVRLLPPGRALVATVVVDGPEPYRIELD